MLAAMRTAIALFLLLAGCAQLRDELQRAEQGYEEARYERANIWLDELEGDVGDMDQPMQARFYFLRGMTAYRLDHRTEALHYLALAKQRSGPRGDGLRREWRELLDSTMEELTPTGPTWHARSRAALEE